MILTNKHYFEVQKCKIVRQQLQVVSCVNKNQILKNTLLFCFFIAALFTGCSNEIDKKHLVGNWKVVDFTVNTSELSPTIVEGGKATALASSYSFKADKTVSLESNYYSQTGKYEILEKSNVLVMTTAEDGSAEIYSIKSLSGNSMVWIQDMGDLGTATLTLTKESTL